MFIWKTHCGLKFYFPQSDRSEICTKVSFTLPKLMWTLIIFRVFIFIFLFKTNGKKGQLHESDVRYCYGNFSKLAFWKLLNCNYVQNSFSTIYKVHWQQHFEKFCSGKFYGHASICANSFIKAEMKIEECALKNISCTKPRVCNSTNIASK